MAEKRKKPGASESALTEGGFLARILNQQNGGFYGQIIRVFDGVHERLRNCLEF